jgi:hypothetical protein
MKTSRQEGVALAATEAGNAKVVSHSLAMLLVLIVSSTPVASFRRNEGRESSSANLTLDVRGLGQNSHATSQDQLGRKTTLSCVSPLSHKLVNLGTTGEDLSDRQQLRNFMFRRNGNLLKRIADHVTSVESDVPYKVREAAKMQILESLKHVANIKSLPALEEFYKIAAGFGIIRRTYESVKEQTWAREVVDCSLALYDGSDFLTYYKPPSEIHDEEGGFKWKTKFKYGRQVFGIANHFFNIYIMTWLPKMEGIIHSHGESACSFKFLSEADGFVQQGFHDVASETGSCPVKSFAFQDWQHVQHFGMTCDEAPTASLKSLDKRTIPSLGNAQRGRVFYIQDDLGVHRFDNAYSQPGFTVNVYYPSYEKTWLFSYFDEDEVLVHTTQGTLKSMTAVSDWLDKHGRDAPWKQMAVWRLPEALSDDTVLGLAGKQDSENVGAAHLVLRPKGG